MAVPVESRRAVSARVVGLAVAASLAGASYTSWRRSCGEACRGLGFATAIGPASTAWALLRPFDPHLAIFPYASTSPGGGNHSATRWVALAIGAVVLAASRSPAGGGFLMQCRVIGAEGATRLPVEATLNLVNLRWQFPFLRPTGRLIPPTASTCV
jgi:hypothetical protein